MIETSNAARAPLHATQPRTPAGERAHLALTRVARAPAAPSPMPARPRPPRPRRALPGLDPLACSAALLVSALLAIAPPAQAEPRREDRVAAEGLFSDARRLMRAGDYAHACPKLEASRELEPALGTTLNLGDCYEKLGRTASAWTEFKSAAAEAQRLGDAARKAIALERAAALEPRLSRLQIDAADPHLTLLRNGEPASTAVLGNPVPIDPGTYRLEARAPGKRAWTATVQVGAEAHLVRVIIPELADAPVTPPGAGDASAIASDPATARAPAGGQDAAPGASGAGRTWAWVLGGVGVAALATGTSLTLLASSNWSKARDACADFPYECSARAVRRGNTADTQATLSSVAFITGGAALAASLALFLTSDAAPSTELAVAPGSVTVKGRF